MKYPPEIYSHRELLGLLRACPLNDVGFRHRAILHFLLATACRIGETLDLRVEDVDLIEGEVFIRHGKGDKSRRLGLPSDTIYHIKCWLARRRRLGLEDRGPLFCRRDGGALRPNTFRVYLHRLAAGAGITKRVHPHAYRHTAATACLRDGWTIADLQGMLGHTSLESTLRYLHKVPQDLVIRKMRSRRVLPEDPLLLEGPPESSPPADS